MKSWFGKDVFEIVDMRRLKIRNFVTGHWALTVKKDKDGKFLKCKARWVLKGFQAKQKDTQQTDSPAASRSGFRCVTQFAANQGWDLYHTDLKTAFCKVKLTMNHATLFVKYHLNADIHHSVEQR